MAGNSWSRLFAWLRAPLLAVKVCGPSMAPLLCDGECVFVLTWWPHSLLRRGQVIIIDPSSGPGPPAIKQIAALPNDLVGRDIDGAVLRVPEGHLFVLGLNRTASIDSRQWGPIPVQRVRGLVLFRVNPV